MTQRGEPSDPSHDRVRLSAHEHAALANLEYELADDRVDGGYGDRVLARLTAHAPILGRLVSRFVRYSAWLALLGILALPVAIAVSDAAGLTCASFITVALMTWLVTPRERWSRWLARQTTWHERADRGRTDGRPSG
jgi:hypothetical protein